MTATKTAKPNKALRALIEQHPAQFQPMLDEGSAAVIRFMNEWAKLHAENPDEAFRFFEVVRFKAIVKEEWDKRNRPKHLYSTHDRQPPTQGAA